ncbi:hypothetical protein [Mycoplasma hafezii]|uniref:hypothetical protein n=1 Tax=Mycoplasma hafezii TaxID=525886 RepID=UPI003CEB00A4
MKQIKNYWSFLSKLLLTKKIIIIVPILWLAISVIAAIVFGAINLQSSAYLVILITAFVEILITIFYSSILYLNIFNDLEKEGMEILALSKSISRKNIYRAKTTYALLFSLGYGILLLFTNLFIGLSLHMFSSLVLLLLVSFFGFVLIFNFFGLITSIIAYYANSKIALTAPLIISTPLMVAGVVLSSYSTSVANNFAYYLNLKYKDNLSGKISNTEEFYLNGDNNLFIVPNGYQNETFSSKQEEFLKDSYTLSKRASSGVVAYSWAILPYQFLDLFNLNEQNVFESVAQHKNYTNSYLNAPESTSYLYNYSLVKNDAANPKTNGLQVFEVLNEKSEAISKFIVPGALKNQSFRNNIVNTNLIYARVGADDFKVQFPEDKYTFSASDNLVGELKWTYLKEVLGDSSFNSYATKLFSGVMNQTNTEDLFATKDAVLETIQSQLADENSFLNTYANSLVTVFNQTAIKNKLIKTDTEKKVYLATALLYHIYFNFNQTPLANAILLNEDISKSYTPSQFKIQINGLDYLIGGYSQYTPIQEVTTIDDSPKVIIRFNLTKSDNYVFQTLDTVYQLEKGAKQVSKIGYLAIWVTLVAVLMFINNYKYSKKDYK